MCAGELNEHFLLITKPDNTSDKNQLVFKLPPLALNGSQVAISGEPVTLKEMWPTLYNHLYYQSMTFNNLIFNSFMAIDKVGQYFLMTTKIETGYPGLVYDLDNNKIFKGLSYNGNKVQVLISSHELRKFYALQRGSQNELTIMRYRFAKESVMESCALPTGSIIPDVEGSFYRICIIKNDFLMVTNDTSCTGMQWTKDKTSLKGFVTQGKFFLFGDENVIIFSSEIYDKLNQPVKFTLKPYGSFIECNISPGTVKSSSGNYLVMLIGINKKFVNIICLIIIIITHYRIKLCGNYSDHFGCVDCCAHCLFVKLS